MELIDAPNSMEWRVVSHCPNYEVSNTGIVRGKNGELKPRLRTAGYLAVVLWNSQGRQEFRIHRLVAEAFIPNPGGKPEIDHIDRNPANNAVENLRWATRSENMLNTRRRDGEMYAIYPSGTKWMVKFQRDLKEVYLGVYATIEEARHARDASHIDDGGGAAANARPFNAEDTDA